MDERAPLLRLREGAQRLADAHPVGAHAALFAVFACIALPLYAPALRGGFVSDDFGYIVTNPYVHALSWENLRALLDPWGPPALYTANWAPLHLLAHAVEWHLWGPEVFGYHVVNVVLHAGVSALLAAWLGSRGFSFVASALAGAFFLLHPANVEAVAWIFQLKTIAALGCAIAALLVHPRSGPLGLVLFSAALLFKASAMFALPVAATLWWIHRDPARPADGWRRSGVWLLGWAVVLALYAQPQFFSFERMGQTLEPLAPDAAGRVRTIAAFGARYLVMATGGFGVSAFHQPPAALTWTHGWWLLGLVLGLALGARLVVALARRREDAVGWVWAGAAWAPISQIFPFLYPMADRYLYMVLPGLMLGAMALGRAWTPPGVARRAAPAACIALVLVLAGFGAWSHARAHVWRDDATLMVDSARHYPEGILGRILAAQEAARLGDARSAAEALRAAEARGFDGFLHLVQDPVWEPIRRDPRFRAARDAIVQRWLRRNLTMQAPGQADLRKRATAYLVLGDKEAAETALTQALARGGAFDAEIRRDLAQVRAARIRERAEARRRGAEQAAPDPPAPR